MDSSQSTDNMWIFSGLQPMFARILSNVEDIVGRAQRWTKIEEYGLWLYVLQFGTPQLFVCFWARRDHVTGGFRHSSTIIHVPPICLLLIIHWMNGHRTTTNHGQIGFYFFKIKLIKICLHTLERANQISTSCPMYHWSTKNLPGQLCDWYLLKQNKRSPRRHAEDRDLEK